MMDDVSFSDILVTIVGLAILLPVCYALAQIAWRVSGWMEQRRMAPLAPAVAGVVDERGVVRGTFQGREVELQHASESVGGSDDSSSRRLHTFTIRLHDVLGAGDWQLRYRVAAWLSNETTGLKIESPDARLAQRLAQARVCESVAASTTLTVWTDFATMVYDARSRTLQYIEDVSDLLQGVPSRAAVEQRLAMVARIATINEEINPA